MHSKQIKQLIFLCVVFLCFSVCKADTDEKQTKIMLRTIGHEFLLELGDSTSLVRPIEKVDGRYVIQFERTFSFEPDVLNSVVYKVLQENNTEEGYIVEIEECETSKVVHSFKVNLLKNDSTIACRGRKLPKTCYAFYFTTINPTEKLSELTPTQVGGQTYLYLIILLLLFGVIAFFIIKKKQSSNTDKITIGQFYFDQKNMTLNLKAQSIELSAKESDLLLLLFNNESKTLERGYILNQIWGDEGDYVGRTLDVFISKLRKKIAADPNLKIINVRGVGYRFTLG